MSRRVLLATHNSGKVAELSALLAGTGWRIDRLAPDAPEFEETGATFADNARGKAAFYAAATDSLALADDSGLEIDALGGEPGVYSARYIDPSMDQVDRNRAVLERLSGVPHSQRGARFVCHLVLATPDRIVHEVRGECSGRISETSSGDNGFGYDPIFLRPELGRTFAQLQPDEKSRLSHRGNAVRSMVGFLRDWQPDV